MPNDKYRVGYWYQACAQCGAASGSSFGPVTVLHLDDCPSLIPSREDGYETVCTGIDEATGTITYSTRPRSRS